MCVFEYFGLKTETLSKFEMSQDTFAARIKIERFYSYIPIKDIVILSNYEVRNDMYIYVFDLHVAPKFISRYDTMSLIRQ